MNEAFEELLTYAQVAERLKIKRSTLQALVACRKIPAIRLTKRTVRFRWREVEAAMAKLTVKSL